jgi:hypothetical protein
LAHALTDQTNIAVGEWVAVVFGKEIFDIDGNFTSNTFTAPTTGKYSFSASVRLLDVDSAADFYNLGLVTSNRAYRLDIIDPGGFYDGSAYDPAYLTLGGAVVADMDAGDTASVSVYQSGGTQQTDIDGNATVLNTFFSGVLVAR